MSAAPLSDRAKQVLKVLIDLYIVDGQPVGSKTIAQLPDLVCSPATIRNVMSDLEALGLLVSTHTSAGRIPTAEGFRLFIDSLLTVKPLDEQAVLSFQQQVAQQHDPRRLIQSTSTLLSQMTQLAGVVTTPKRNQVIFSQIEFLKLSPQRVLVVLVLNNAEVENRIIITPREFSSSELTQSANYLTQQFGGLALTDVRQALVAILQQEKNQIDTQMQAVMSVAEQTLEEIDSTPDYAVSGQNNLVQSIDDTQVDSLKRLFDAFTEKQDILQLLDQCIKADGVQIFIGEESGVFGMQNYSLVTAPYQADDTAIGIIGVIGPTRMAYDRVVPLVDMTSKILSMAMENEG